MADASVDSIVTDPPYELGFMGKSWDASGIAFNVDVWREALRVLKPGGHLLAFGGSRTYHRMACAIEDAGFEIRDQIMWLYGSGFPKSLDVSKAIDKAAGAEREVVGIDPVRFARLKNQIGGSVSTGEQWEHGGRDVTITAPATEAARQWQGWGTALKPAHEPIVVARKPLVGTVAENVLQFGTGALNIDGCRVEGGARPLIVGENDARKFSGDFKQGSRCEGTTTAGRWPANVIHDGSEEVLAVFPQAKGQQGALTGSEPSSKTASVYGEYAGRTPAAPRIESDKSAARFFYCAKASKRDRDEGLEGFEVKRTGGMQATADGSMLTGSGNERTTARANIHPTVKPTDLMRYLCRLVTPPGGLVLDPFMGSGSTGKAAMLEGFRFVGIELSEEYIEIARARIASAAR